MNQSLRFSISLLILLIGADVCGQQSWISERGSPLNTVAIEVMPRLDNAKLRASSRSLKKEGTPYKFAEAISHTINANDKGTWETLDNGDLLWRQRILSPGAFSLNFGITSFYLPPTAKMFLYDQSKSYVVGPLSNKDNEKHNQWWSPIIPGEEVVIEIQIKAEDRATLELQITKVNHDYKGFGAAISGSCNVDVICGGADDETLAIIDRFRDQINSVGMYTLNGVEQCSGSLINNARNDCTPYFLTANHCEVRENNAASVVVYWNYQQSSCRLPGSVESGRTGDGTRTEFNSGATVKANYDQSDLSLLLLDDDVDPTTNPFFAGWDIDGEVFDSTFCIHHPSTQEKRISFDFDQNEPRVDVFFHRIADWDIGTTEGGSSGSPLFNMDKRIIGKLTGGDAACENNLQDDYGMLKLSWTGGGTSETRLSDWLDPDNTGITQIDGRYCVDVVRISETTLNYCTLDSRTDTTILFVQSGYVNGATASISSGTQGLDATINKIDVIAGDSIEVIINILFDFNQDDGEIVVTLTDEGGSTDFPIKVVVDRNLPLPPSHTNPTDGTENINFDVDFGWESSGFRHQIDFSNTEEFNEIIRTEIIENTKQVTLKGFEPKTIYFWRVKSTNECGEGTFSTPTKFTTGVIECNIYTAQDLPITIGEEAVTITSFIDIDIDGAIADVNINNLKGLHTWIGDLTFFLISPSGTEVRIAVSPCDDEDNFDISFDDESDNVILPCPLIDDISYRPFDALSAFDDEPSRGRWTLRVDDDARLDGGSLDGWDLELCLNLSQSRSISLSPNEITICQNSPIDSFNIEGTLLGDYQGDINLGLFDPEGNIISAVFSSNPLTGSGSKMFNLTMPNYEGLEDQDALILVATDELGSDTTSINIVLSNPIIAPTIINPADNAAGVEPKTQFSWEPVVEVEMYRLIVSTDVDMVTVAIDTVISDNNFAVTSKLTLGQQYYWNVTALGACVNATNMISTFTIDIVDATIDPTLQSVLVYPNPTNGELYIDNKSSQEIVNFQIINSLGAIISTDQLSRESKRVDISDYANGVYMLRLVSDRGILVKPIIKTQ